MVVCEMWIKHWRKKNVSLLLLHGDYLIMISNENTRWLTVALEKIKNCATMENSESTALHCVNESDFFLLCVCYIIVLKMPEIKNGILFPARFKQPLWSASRNLTTKGKPLLIHFIVKKYINEAGGVRWGLEGLTDCTLFMQNAKPTLQKDQFLIQLWLC